MKKIENLRTQMPQKGIDGLFVMSPYNRRYISGFTGTAGAALVTHNEAIFLTDFRYTEQAAKQAEGFTVIQHTKSLFEEAMRQADRLGVKTLGFEKEHVTYQEFELLQNYFSGALQPVAGLVENLRLIKTESEIKILKEACDIADAAFKHILDFLKPGVREIDVSNELEFFMRKCGAASSSFDIIVASGARSALPHGVASEKKIESGDFVTLDFGAYYKGYASDITRTVAVGEPSDQLKDIYSIVLEAQMAAVDQIKPGMTGKEADAVARDIISSKGYGDAFGHSTGHGLGLEVHESPRLSVLSDKPLQSGMVVTVEPGIYLPGVGGVRIEDDIVLTENGNERLTHSAKELIIL
ncbi:M24 family metallopeptidase [Domibacillus enclensis]|uniref:Xaa-Pro aminopeptidase n=1 Tax=Domibacillus enclensis TaxID=1017273 RepID=A0A1N6PIE3_9BACI|nr:aminopeptidase P family protein [Domibacillus enclensis]OXS80376.1 Xaa-Pro dipeptidase [Domibacillus enclensis]SIQ03969.1 Xaa-Pro aminopeptidase [Domibacillus enclensis]